MVQVCVVLCVMCVCECVYVLCVWCEHTRIYVLCRSQCVDGRSQCVDGRSPCVDGREDYYIAISFGTHCGSRHGTTIQRHGGLSNRMTLAA